MRRVAKAFAVGCLTVLAAVSANAQEGQGQGQGNMQDFMKAMGAVMSGSTNPAAVVDFRDLKALLPPTFEGMSRTNFTGEKNGALGMTISSAEATYETQTNADSRITIKISDNGGMGGLMALAQAGWAAADIDKESDTGFERTTTYSGNKAHEQYDNQSKSGKIEVMVTNRFMVELNGQDIAFEKIEGALKKIDLAKLATLKPKVAEQQPPAK